jgi:hypothetical protein
MHGQIKIETQPLPFIALAVDNAVEAIAHFWTSPIGRPT